jgi:hypothetical protein
LFVIDDAGESDERNGIDGDGTEYGFSGPDRDEMPVNGVSAGNNGMSIVDVVKECEKTEDRGVW